MKRSTMLKIIKNTDDDMTGWQAEKILEAIEKAGMLPPYDPQNHDRGSIVDCEWTPEDTETTPLERVKGMSDDEFLESLGIPRRR